MRSSFKILSGIVFSLMSLYVQATPGDFDKRFGGTGIVDVPLPVPGYGEAYKIAIDHDNRSIVVGTISDPNNRFFAYLHAKLNDGTTDTTFGTAGFVVSPGMPIDIGIDTDNRIVVVLDGENGSAFSVKRFNPNGTLDSTFGTQGSSPLTYPAQYNLYYWPQLALDKLNNIYLSNNIGDGVDSLFAIVKMDATGVLDSSFGVSGVAVLHLVASPERSESGAIAVDANNNVYVTGEILTSIDPFTWASHTLTTKLTSTGALDTSFGMGGVVHTDALPAFLSPHVTYPKSIAIDRSGNIVIAGGTGECINFPCTNGHFFATRYTSGGVLDSSFGNGGTFLSGLFGAAEAQTVLIDGRNNLVLTGMESQNGVRNDAEPMVMRLKNDGSMDTTFGSSGVKILDKGIAGGVSAFTQSGDIMILSTDTATHTQLIQESLISYDALRPTPRIPL